MMRTTFSVFRTMPPIFGDIPSNFRLDEFKAEINAKVSAKIWVLHLFMSFSWAIFAWVVCSLANGEDTNRHAMKMFECVKMSERWVKTIRRKLDWKRLIAKGIRIPQMCHLPIWFATMRNLRSNNIPKSLKLHFYYKHIAASFAVAVQRLLPYNASNIYTTSEATFSHG